MYRNLKKLTITGLIVTALPLTFLAATAGSASAAPATLAHASVANWRAAPRCHPSPYTGKCYSPTVQGTPFSSGGSNGDWIHNAPNDSPNSRVGFLPVGVSTTVYCYAIGQSESGPGASNDPYWDFVVYNGVPGFVSDAWLNTKGNITSQVFSCVSGLT